MSQISRLKSAEISNGNLINANDIGAELDQLVSSHNDSDTRLTTLESGDYTQSGNVTFSNNPKTNAISERTAASGVTIDSVLHKDGYIKLAPTTQPYVPASEGEVGVDTTNHLYKGYLNGSVVNFVTTALIHYPIGFHGSAPPVYASSSTFTIAYMRERSADDTVNLTKSGSTTISTATLGAVSGIAQSANQTGTCSTSGSSTTLTFSGIDPRTIFQVGDVVAPSTGAGPRRITALSSTTATLESALTVTASSTYKRGGLAPNTHYYLYAISDGTTPGWILSTRNVAGGDTLVDLPSGYSTTTARQIPFAIRIDGSSNIIPFVVGTGWPYRPLILYRDYEKAASPYQMLSGGTQTSFTAVSLATLMPSISKLAELYVETSGSSSGIISIRATGSGLSTGHAVGTVVSTTAVSRQDVPFVMTDSSQSIDYKTSNASANPSIDLRGYWVTEVP